MNQGPPAADADRPPRLTHLAVVVRRLESAEVLFNRLGLGVASREVLSSDAVRVAFVPVGEAAIELVQPTGCAGPLERFLAAKGEGVHHMALEVADIDAFIAAARAAGFRLIDETARIGAHGTRIAFIHPRSTHGVLIELVQRASGHDADP